VHQISDRSVNRSVASGSSQQIATGLVKNWKEMANHAPSATDTTVLGSLDDEDASATKPMVKAIAKLPTKVPKFDPSVGRDMSQKNDVSPLTTKLSCLTDCERLQVVMLIESDSETVPVKMEKPTKPRKLKAEKAMVPALTTHSESYIATSTTSKENIPEFTKVKWRKVFLPSLYDAFYAADELFENFKKGSEKLQEFLQTMVSNAFPNFHYKVQLGDSFMVTVRIIIPLSLCASIDAILIGLWPPFRETV
jgi:hypothetical protein